MEYVVRVIVVSSADRYPSTSQALGSFPTSEPVENVFGGASKFQLRHPTLQAGLFGEQPQLSAGLLRLFLVGNGVPSLQMRMRCPRGGFYEVVQFPDRLWLSEQMQKFKCFPNRESIEIIPLRIVLFELDELSQQRRFRARNCKREYGPLTDRVISNETMINYLSASKTSKEGQGHGSTVRVGSADASSSPVDGSYSPRCFPLGSYFSTVPCCESHSYMSFHRFLKADCFRLVFGFVMNVPGNAGSSPGGGVYERPPGPRLRRAAIFFADFLQKIANPR